MNDLARALAAEQDDLVAAFVSTLESGWLVQGPAHAAFEATLAEYVGARHAIGVASGTDALELALRAAMPAGRRTVVTAANCGGYTTTAARRAGYHVRYADIDHETLLLDPQSLAGVIDRRVGVVVVTHLYGRAADVQAVQALARDVGAVVLEDCAQALGARTDNGPVGSLADVAAFSFYPTKNLGALGDGGAVATSSPEIADQVRTLRQYGWRGKYTIGEDGGRNSRLDELQAAVLQRRISALDAGNARRREIITAYAAQASERIHVLPADTVAHAGHLGVLRTDQRDALRRHLDDHGIKTDIHYPVPDHLQPAFRGEYPGLRLPVTEAAATEILSVPVFPELADAEIERVCDALGSF
jgi:dTDP-4-amino-4,6-dideoxygalactose transaminase